MSPERLESDDARARALLTLIAAKLELAIAEQHLSKASATLRNILRGRDHRISSLVEAADYANCDVTVTITRKSA